MLAENKFNSIETLMSQALNDLKKRIYYDFEGKRQIWKDEIQFNKWKRRWKARNYKLKQYKIKKINAINFFSLYIKMLETTKKNCYKCDLETVIDNDNSQYFWINLREFEAETENKWLKFFSKYGNKSTLKYRRELTPKY